MKFSLVLEFSQNCSGDVKISLNVILTKFVLSKNYCIDQKYLFNHSWTIAQHLKFFGESRFSEIPPSPNFFLQWAQIIFLISLSVTLGNFLITFYILCRNLAASFAVKSCKNSLNAKGHYEIAGSARWHCRKFHSAPWHCFEQPILLINCFSLSDTLIIQWIVRGFSSIGSARDGSLISNQELIQ